MSFLTDSAQMMRAILFASARATSFGGFSAIILRSQGSSSSSRLRKGVPVGLVAEGVPGRRGFA